MILLLNYEQVTKKTQNVWNDQNVTNNEMKIPSISKKIILPRDVDEGFQFY